MTRIAITGIEARPFSMPLTAPVRYGTIERRRSASVLVRVRGENGLTGCGEACAVPQLTGESAESVAALIDGHLRGSIPGSDLRDWRVTMGRIRRQFPRSPVALSAVETALLDLVGKSHGLPVWALLGGRCRDRVETCASVSWNADAAAMAEETRRKRAFACFKVYIGTGEGRAALTGIEAVRTAAGEEARIMLDVKGLWSMPTAVAVAPELVRLGVFLVEQPLRREDRTGAAEVTRIYRERFGLLTAGDESVETAEDVIHVATGREFSSLNVGGTKMGGPDTALRAAEVARAAGMPVLVGSFAELGIATAAGVHLAAALPEVVAPAYLSGPDRFVHAITTPTLAPEGGWIAVPDAPGLGIEVDEERIAALAAGGGKA